MFAVTRRLRLVLLLLAANPAFAQANLSADLVDLQKSGSPILAKFYMAHGKRRIDMESFAGDDAIYIRLFAPTTAKSGAHISVGGSGNAIIIDLTSKESTVLWPEQTKYVKHPVKQLVPAELYALYAFIQPTDVDNACGEWMQRAGSEGESCRKVGKETVDTKQNAVRVELAEGFGHDCGKLHQNWGSRADEPRNCFSG